MFLKRIKGVVVLSLFYFLLLGGNVLAQENLNENQVNIYLFYSRDCSHCIEEKNFLNELVESDSRIKVSQFEITKNKENEKLFKDVVDKLRIPETTRIQVPFTVIGSSYFIGWMGETSTGEQMKRVIDEGFKGEYTDVIGENFDLSTDYEQTSGQQQLPETINLPIIGEIHVRNVSLPVLTFAVAFLDGFNPCAMWTLIFLITLLLGMKDRRKMWILGMTFIASSAFVYFLFLSAWFQLFNSIGSVFWIRMIIGVVAIGAGVYNLKKYVTQPPGVCNVAGGQKTQKIFEKLKVLIREKSFFIALVGIIALAFVVNLVELACSAGFPAIYTQVLVLSDLPTYQYYLYLLFYILIFMLDDLFVFFVAMTTLNLTGVNAKYSKMSELVGGIIMLIIGVLLILRPDLLSFGM